MQQQPYNQQTRLHSPLLDGNKTNGQIPTNNKSQIEDTLKNTIYLQNTKDSTQGKNNIDRFKQTPLHTLESLLKVGNVLILGIGGILCLIELSIIIKTASQGSYDFGNNLMLFALTFILTITANALMLAFFNLIKMTKIIFINLEDQNNKLNKIIEALKIRQ